MKKNEIIYAKKQRDNVSFLKIHKMLASDLLFFYTTCVRHLLKNLDIKLQLLLVI